MSNKRIYLGRENSKYAYMIGGAIVTIISLMTVLQMLGFEITGTDDTCLGTPEDPCVSYGTICNRGNDNYDIYNPEGIRLDFEPDVKEYWMFFKDGRVKKEFLIPQGINASTKGWRYENFTNYTKPLKDRVYVHRFARYSCQEYMIVGLKNNPEDKIKWGFGIKNEYLDPVWLPVEETNKHPIYIEEKQECHNEYYYVYETKYCDYKCPEENLTCETFKYGCGNIKVKKTREVCSSVGYNINVGGTQKELLFKNYECSYYEDDKVHITCKNKMVDLDSNTYYDLDDKITIRENLNPYLSRNIKPTIK